MAQYFMRFQISLKLKINFNKLDKKIIKIGTAVKADLNSNMEYVLYFTVFVEIDFCAKNNNNMYKSDNIVPKNK